MLRRSSSSLTKEDQAQLCQELADAMHATEDEWDVVDIPPADKVDVKAETEIKRMVAKLEENLLQRWYRGAISYDYLHGAFGLLLSTGTDLLVPPMVAKPAKFALGLFNVSPREKRIKELEAKLVEVDKTCEMLRQEIERLRLALAEQSIRHKLEMGQTAREYLPLRAATNHRVETHSDPPEKPITKVSLGRRKSFRQ